MLGKLLKHEFKDTGKILLPLNLVLIGVTILGMIILGLKMFNSDFMAMVAISMLLLYILAIAALFIMTYVYLMIRFYRSMYASEGYLTHTLPVSPIATLNSKLIISVFWSFLTLALCILSVFALIRTGLATTGYSTDYSLIISQIESIIGSSLEKFIGIMILMMFLSTISNMLMIYTSISIGQLFNKYKILASIVTYIIIYIILQIINTLSMFGSTFSSYTDEILDSGTTYGNIGNFYNSIFVSSTIQSLVLIAIFYAITAYISSKKVNLD